MLWFSANTISHARALCGLAAFLVCAVVLPAIAAQETADGEHNGAKNIARMNCGARIEAITSDGRVVSSPAGTKAEPGAAALIMDDNTLSYPLAEGAMTFVISFPRTSELDRFTFVNENAAAEGELSIAVSNYQLPAASPKWTTVNSSVAFTGKRVFNLSLVGVEARYVKLSFSLQKGGRIAALGLYGRESLQAFSHRRSGIVRTSNPIAARRMEDMLNFNYANLYAKARVVFVSSGTATAARRMIDDDPTTAFKFDASDPQPMTVIELAESERLHRVSALYKAASGRLDVYVLQRNATRPEDLGGAKLVASVTDETGTGKAAVDFNPEGARYVAFRWTPAAGGGESHDFEVAEVHAFGDMPLAMLNTYEAPELYANNSIELAGDGGVDFSNKLGTLAEPPRLAEVSP